jgi:hypothetical protein
VYTYMASLTERPTMPAPLTLQPAGPGE